MKKKFGAIKKSGLKILFLLRIWWFFFADVFSLEKKMRIFFFSIFLESFETYTKKCIKIGAKLNFLLNEKIKIGKLFFHTFQIIDHLLGPKTRFSYFFWREGGVGVGGLGEGLHVVILE